MMQHCNTVNKQTSVIFLHHTIKKASKRLLNGKEYCHRKCQREQVQAENLLRGVRQEVHPGAGCVNKVAWHAGLRYHRLCIQHKCQHLCSHRWNRGKFFVSWLLPGDVFLCENCEAVEQVVCIKNCGQRFSKQERSGMRIVQYVLDEISLIRERDPAINSPAEVFLYPCFWAVLWYRLAHRLYLKDILQRV